MSNPAPGFARYPNHRVTVTRRPSHVRALVGDAVVADSRAALLVEESGHAPVWYFPAEDVHEGRLTPTDSSSYCPFKGHASYFTVEAGGARLEDAAWAYPAPYDECRSLAGYVAFYPDRVAIEVDGDRQRPT
ncbi:MAG TPA: DUF427 domain-containing protein [Pseudomonadales bacterium]